MSPKPLILVVDDDPPVVALMASLLREFGFEPATAMSGMDALVVARARRPSLILVDKNMPRMTGEQVISALRAEPGIEGVPILILSGEPTDPTELARIGANGAIQKPFDVSTLIAEIRGYIADDPA